MSNLQENAVLVDLGVSQWTARKFDKRASRDVTDNNNAERDAARVNKLLVPAKGALAAVGQAATAARTFHYSNTLPWIDKGARLLPVKNFDTYRETMSTLRAAFEDAVRTFMAEYPSIQSAARDFLGNLYNPSEYPSPRDMERRFRFDVDFSPVPDRDDFRVSLDEMTVGEMRDSIERRVRDAEGAAMQDLWIRLYQGVKHAAERLGQPDAIFRDSLIENLLDLCKLLPRLNVAGDPALENMRQDVERKLCAWVPGDLREDPKARKAAAQDADAIMTAMAGYMGSQDEEVGK